MQGPPLLPCAPFNQCSSKILADDDKARNIERNPPHHPELHSPLQQNVFLAHLDRLNIEYLVIESQSYMRKTSYVAGMAFWQKKLAENLA